MEALTLFHLAHDTRRYGEINRAVGAVSHEMLIQQLEELETDGPVNRVDYKEIPPGAELANSIRSALASALAPLCEWGTAHAMDVGKSMANRKASTR
jgi:DNA-binding HxlR family transcriptional regulator